MGRAKRIHIRGRWGDGLGSRGLMAMHQPASHRNPAHIPTQSPLIQIRFAGRGPG